MVVIIFFFPPSLPPNLFLRRVGLTWINVNCSKGEASGLTVMKSPDSVSVWTNVSVNMQSKSPDTLASLVSTEMLLPSFYHTTNPPPLPLHSYKENTQELQRRAPAKVTSVRNISTPICKKKIKNCE